MPDETIHEPIRPAAGQRTFIDLQDSEDTLPKLGKHHDISMFCSGESARYALECVHYDDARKRLEACNGRCLIAVPVDGDPVPEALFDGDVLHDAIADAGPDGTVQMLQVDGQCLLAVPNIVTRKAPIGEGKFPDVAKNFPQMRKGFKPAHTMTLSTSELLNIVKYAKANKAHAICFAFDMDGAEVTSGIRFTFPQSGDDLLDRVVGIVMPRVSGDSPVPSEATAGEPTDYKVTITAGGKSVETTSDKLAELPARIKRIGKGKK